MSAFRFFVIPALVLTIHTVVPYGTGVAGPVATGGGSGAVPDHDIYYTNNKNIPQWKIDWDQARALYRKGKSGQALVQYELLLQKKSNIDEARWEYASILIQEKRWRQAGKELDTLLLHDSDNRKYILARAGVSLHEGRVEQAVRQYGELYGSNPESPDAVRALRGLIDALGYQGNKEAQLPLLELLLLRMPGDRRLLQRTGALALELGKPEKTRDLLEQAITEHPDDTQLIKLLARTETQLKNTGKAADYWQQLVALDPDDIQANTWLANYYLHKGNIAMTLIHVERQLKVDPINADLILQAARLHKRMGRPGKALDYFSLYLELVPDDPDVRHERDSTRKILSSSLIALVRGNRGDNIEQLWKDVGRMTSDREGVFMEMADRFRTDGKKRELTQVLLVLHRHLPADTHIYQELVPLLEAEGRMNELNSRQ